MTAADLSDGTGRSLVSVKGGSLAVV